MKKIKISIDSDDENIKYKFTESGIIHLIKVIGKKKGLGSFEDYFELDSNCKPVNIGNDISKDDDIQTFTYPIKRRMIKGYEFFINNIEKDSIKEIIFFYNKK